MTWTPRRLAPRPARGRAGERGQSIVEFALIAPIMLLLMFAILDLARVYTTMMSVESAAREAADFGTSFGAEKWAGGAPTDDWIAEMRRRACIAASDLPDYVGIDADANGVDEDCSNPAFAYCMTPTPSGTCAPVDPAIVDFCHNADRDPPCTVTVTLSHDFQLFVPFHIDFFGVELGLPGTLSFTRDSTFAMTDIDVASPGP